MANIQKINGLSIAELPGDSIKKELVKVVEKQLGLKNFELGIELGSKKGDNFMGEIYRILFKRFSDNKVSSLILKIAPNYNGTDLSKRGPFLREILMYDEVLPFFNDIQISKGINPYENGFNECAKCFSSLNDEFSECLFLEDLRLRQFEMINMRQEAISFEHMSLLMKALGKFHAISFAIKDQQPDKLNQFKVLFNEQYWTGVVEPFFKPFFVIAVNRFMTCLQEEKRFDLLEKFKQAVGDDPNESVNELVSLASADPFAVICHGDVTTNNTMFRKDDQGKPIEVQLIDWQFSRYASPVIELVLYLFCSSTKELRDKHYEDFLKIYHESLSNLLSRLGSDPQKLFPYEALLDQFRKFGVYAAFVGSLLLPVLFADIDSISSADNVPTTDDEIQRLFLIPDELKQIYCRRVVDMFDDLARFGYI